MESAIPAPKTKRVLTEAQRLAFLKGREKRMANIEKRRLEKEEAKQLEEAKPEPVSVSVTEPAPASAPEPTPAKVSPPKIDEKKIADTVADRVWAKLQEAKPKRKPYTRKTSAPAVPSETQSEQVPEPPRVQSFTWL